MSIKEVAKKAGVSTATVSYVLNGSRGTKAHTKKRVLDAVAALGYAQNRSARNLVTGKSTLLGLIVSDIRNPFFPEITAAFQNQALRHDMDALVLNTNYDSHRTLTSVKRLIGLQVPGVAVLTSQIDPSVIEMLSTRGIKAVCLDLGPVGPSTSNIVLDYEHGIDEALEYLTKLGHRRIAYIGGPLHLHSSQRRKKAFLDATARLGLAQDKIIDADFTVSGGYFACSKLLLAAPPTAILAANDLIAIGVLHRAYDGGLKVPGDLSVVGFDDILFAEYAQPALTSVAVPREEIGKLAFQALWDMMSDPRTEGREYRLGTHLIQRQSAGPAPAES